MILKLYNFHVIERASGGQSFSIASLRGSLPTFPFGKEQVAISQIEKRTDMLLSTLRGYVEAMGGNLSLVVQFDDREPVFLTGLSDEEPRSRPRRVVERSGEASAG
jgi:hypothetical protein